MRMTSQQWTVASLGSGAMALVCLLLAVATTHWLHLTETCYKFTTLPFEGVNISLWANFTMWTNVGLWQLCSITDTDPTPVCNEVGLSQGLTKTRQEGQFLTGSVTAARTDMSWNYMKFVFTFSILSGILMEQATRIQFPVTCLAVVLTLSGFVCSIVGNFKKDKKTIFAAVCYILSGLCLSVGVILYISSINDELSFQQSKDCYEFKYQYSWSFYLVGISFVMEETSAVISIKLYLERNFHKLDMMLDILPGLDAKLNEESTCLKRLDSQSQTLIW